MVLLPYRVTSGSGVMFDALGHGIPFVASDFTEFAVRGLGIVAKRTPEAFADALLELDNNYEVNEFKENLREDFASKLGKLKHSVGTYDRLICATVPVIIENKLILISSFYCHLTLVQTLNTS